MLDDKHINWRKLKKGDLIFYHQKLSFPTDKDEFLMIVLNNNKETGYIEVFAPTLYVYKFMKINYASSPTVDIPIVSFYYD